MKAEPIVVERVLNAPIAKVWQALTQKEQMKWYCDPDDFKLEVGFRFMFYGNPKAKTWATSCQVIAFDPLKQLDISWSFDDYPGISLVSWQLFAEGDKTRLKLTHSGLENIPAEAKDLKWEEFLSGWEHYIDTALTNYLVIKTS